MDWKHTKDHQRLHSMSSLWKWTNSEWRSAAPPSCLGTVCVCVCVRGNVCVLGVGRLRWQSPGRTAGCSPCGGAQGSLSQQDLVTSKEEGKGKHSAEVPLSAGLEARARTHTHTLGITHTPRSKNRPLTHTLEHPVNILIPVKNRTALSSKDKLRKQI